MAGYACRVLSKGVKELNEYQGKHAIIEELRKVLQKSPIFPRLRHVFIGQDFFTKELSKEVWSLLKPAGIWVGHTAMETCRTGCDRDHPWMVTGPDGRGDCRTSLPLVTNYATFMSMRNPNGWQIPQPGICYD